jgi:hypothetical protein
LFPAAGLLYLDRETTARYKKRFNTDNSMTKLKLALLALFITTVSYAQKFATNIDISPVVTFGSNRTTQNAGSFGFAASIREYYKISKKIRIGAGIEYSSANYKLLRHVDDPNTDYESKVLLEAIAVPVTFRYQTEKYWFFQTSYGIAFVTNSKSNVQYTFSYTDSNGEYKSIITGINDKTDDFNNKMHSFVEFGFGKEFKVKQLMISFQLFYQSTIGAYNFSHLGYRQATFIPCYYDYKIRPQQTGLKIGIEL